MGFYRQPQNVWLRRAMFQIHLWTGLGVGVYIVVVCLTGSVLVFRLQLTRKYANRPQIALHADQKPLTENELRSAALKALPAWNVEKVWRGRRANSPVDIWMNRGPGGKERTQHLFNPYTGADLGETRPRGIRAIEWLVSLHDDLLGGMNGRIVNGIGSILLTLLVITGMIIWWQGRSKWTRGFLIRWRGGWQRINWDLHSAVGFWTLIAVAGWAISGIYLVFPHPFSAIVDYLEPGDPFSRLPRRGDIALEWLAKLHFGRFAGAGTQWTWAILGIIPPVLFITGAVMWWNRVLSRTFTRRDSFNAQPVDRIRGRRSHGRAHGLAVAGRGVRALRVRHER